MVSTNIDTSKILTALRVFPHRVQVNVLVGAVRAAAVVAKDEAKILVPKKTGNLARSIIARRRRSNKDNEIIFGVGYSKKKPHDGYYGLWVELGTSKMPAKPFLRPALAASHGRVLPIMQKYIAKRLPVEINKIRQAGRGERA